MSIRSRPAEVGRYIRLEKLGEGNYGTVYRGRDLQTGEFVAMKLMRPRHSPGQDGEDALSASTIREISTLKELSHPCIIALKDLIHLPPAAYMVFECLDYDLRYYMNSLNGSGARMSAILVKSYTYQLLSGIAHCHKHRIVHRDLKPENILLDKDGKLKIADFGLARSYTSLQPSYTNRVVTLWYRAPELLLDGAGSVYGTAVDIWSVGCILGELLTNNAMFQGDSEYNQMMTIFSSRGTPLPIAPADFDPAIAGYPWPGVDKMSNYNPSWPKFYRQHWTNHPTFKELPQGTLTIPLMDLLEKLLCYPPLGRITAREALRHPFFDEYVELRRYIDLETQKNRSLQPAVARRQQIQDAIQKVQPWEFPSIAPIVDEQKETIPFPSAIDHRKNLPMGMDGKSAARSVDAARSPPSFDSVDHAAASSDAEQSLDFAFHIHNRR